MNLDHIKFIGNLKEIDSLKSAMEAFPEDCLSGKTMSLEVELNGGVMIYPPFMEKIQGVHIPSEAKNPISGPNSVSFSYKDVRYHINFDMRIDSSTKVIVESELKRKYKIED